MAETEAVLLRRFARTGDAEAFAEIIGRHAGLVYGAALRILADVDRAADVAQETFLQLMRDAEKVTGSLPGWLHRVATHKAIDQMRRDASRQHREAQYSAKQPREATEWRHLSRYVDEGLNELDTETRDILVTHFLQGRTTRQIAIVHGISQATVSRRIDAGVMTLRGILRRRGIIVAGGALVALLGENAVQAAPAALTAELGKMALLGGPAVAASAAGTTGASGAQAVAGGVLAGVKAKAVAVATVAVIGAGSVVTYQHATRPSPSGNIVITRPATPRPSRPAPRATTPSPTRSAPAAGRSEAAQRWLGLIRAGLNQTGARDASAAAQIGPMIPADAPSMAAEEAGLTAAGDIAGGLAMAGGGPAESQDTSEPQTGQAMGMGGFATFGYGGPPADPNDSSRNAADGQ